MKLEKYKLSVLKLFVETVVDCEEHFSETKGMDKTSLIEWFWKYVSWHEIYDIPSVESVVCVKCMKIRNADNYVYGKYVCGKCNDFVIVE